MYRQGNEFIDVPVIVSTWLATLSILIGARFTKRASWGENLDLFLRYLVAFGLFVWWTGAPSPLVAADWLVSRVFNGTYRR